MYIVYFQPPGIHRQQTCWCQQHPPRCHRRSSSSPSNPPLSLDWGTRRTRCRWNRDKETPFSWRPGPPWKVKHEILQKVNNNLVNEEWPVECNLNPRITWHRNSYIFFWEWQTYYNLALLQISKMLQNILFTCLSLVEGLSPSSESSLGETWPKSSCSFWKGS